MKLNITKEWLLGVLSIADDSMAAAGGASLEELKKKAEGRTVTPAVLTGIPTNLGRVVRFKREELGLSPTDLARRAEIEEIDIKKIEKEKDFHPSPRTIVNLAQALGLSSDRLKKLANHVIEHSCEGNESEDLPFAAMSNGTGAITSEGYEYVRALVSVLSVKTGS